MRYILIILIVILVNSCSSKSEDLRGSHGDGGNVNNSNTQVDYSQWSIPISEVFDGGPGKDGIPSIEKPSFYEVLNVEVDSYINDDDLVVGVKIGEEYRAYPHKILNWHEVINDVFVNSKKLTINYCPLTGTAFAWEFKSNKLKTDFGVSGLLYNSNLIMYDRSTNSNWSQLKLECVNGSLLGEKPLIANVIEMPWKDWKSMFPNSKVLSNLQGYDRNYNDYPYGPYLEVDDLLLFPVNPLNEVLPNKERVFTIIINDMVTAFRFDDFENSNIIKYNWLGKEYLVIGNKNIITSFEISNEFKDVVFEYSYSGNEEFFKDSRGNKWNVFGKVIEGVDQGVMLKASKSVMGYWFAIAAFYPNPEIYN